MTDVLEIPVTTIDGEATTLAEHAGKVLLVVNVASKCGLTPQYEGLEALYEATRDRGFEVLGFPANDFGGQEPGTEAEIVEFCSTNYSVTFPMYSKVVATGADKHPLYDALTTAVPKGEGGDYEALPREPAELRHEPDRRPRGALELREVPDREGRHRGPPLRPHGHPRRPGAGRGHRGRALPLTPPLAQYVTMGVTN